MKAIYKITNIVTQKSYIGQSTDPARRWIAHKSRGKNYDESIDGRSALHQAIKKYGEEAFELEILGWFEDYNEKEKEYIQKYGTLSPNGYNLLPGGEEPPRKYGEDHHNSVYSEELVNYIREDLLSGKFTQKQIELKYNVNQNLVTSINRGETHKKEGLNYPLMKVSPYHLKEEEIEEIRYLLKNSMCTVSEIANYYGKHSSTVKAINVGRRYPSENYSYPIRDFRGKAKTQSVEAILAKRSTLTIDT